MTSSEHRNFARQYLRKAEDYLASAEDNLTMERSTPAAGDAIHAGISAKDAIVVQLTGETRKAKEHGAAAKELRSALGARSVAASAERSLRELIAVKADVEYGVRMLGLTRVEGLVRRARNLVQLAVDIVRLGR